MRYIKAVNNPSSDLDREEVVLWQKVFGRTLSRARDSDGKVKDLVSKMMWVLQLGTNLSNLVKPNQAFTKFLHWFSAHVHGKLTTDSLNEHTRLILYATRNFPPELQECFILVLNNGDYTPLVIELYKLKKKPLQPSQPRIGFKVPTTYTWETAPNLRVTLTEVKLMEEWSLSGSHLAWRLKLCHRDTMCLHNNWLAIMQ